MMAALKKKDALPAKESALFKQILRQYEHKQYKKGLKTAEQILKKYPNHGETLAMKGLFLNNLEQKLDAHEFVKKGLKCDLFSPICTPSPRFLTSGWHVYGLLHRSEKNYEEAMKCYRHALKYDQENIQVLRDFSFLQVQMRDFDGFNETQHLLLRLRPTQRMYWIGLAVSHHLLGQFEAAINVLDVYEQTAKDRAEGTVDYEHSELMMYKTMILEESGSFEKALEHLEANQKDICDRLSWKEQRAKLLLKLERFSDAEACYRELIANNCESYQYFHGLVAALQCDPANAPDQKKILQLLTELQTTYPRSNVFKRLPLDFASGEQFHRIADEYLRSMLRKGVPSLFANLKPLYKDSGKVSALRDLMEGYLESLKSTGTFASSDSDSEPPSAYLWVLYFWAQHLDRIGEYEKALGIVDEAIQHTSTLLELHMFRARILKHMGDISQAAKTMNEARELDLQDRFINTKCAKYYARACEFDAAEKTIVLFARQGAFEEQVLDLVEMQCMWFALECGNAYSRLKQFGPALKRYHQIAKHFEDITDDQFDFHTYCMRKMTLRSYVGLLRLEDRLRDHSYYVDAAIGAIQCYLMLADGVKSASLDPEAKGTAEALSSEEKKRLSKQRRAAAKEQSVEPSKDSQSDKKAALKDDDPLGEKLLVTKSPLTEARKFLEPLQRLLSESLKTHVLSFEVYIRQKKYVLAFKALKQAQRVDQSNPDVHRIAAQFWATFQALTSDEKSLMHALAIDIIEEDWRAGNVDGKADMLKRS